MKCIDFLKTAPICAKILAIVTFIFLLCSTIGFLIISSVKLVDYKAKVEGFQNCFDRCDPLQKDCAQICNFEAKVLYSIRVYISAIMIAFSMLSMIAWILWILWYNFGIMEFLGRYIYYISIGFTILLLGGGIPFTSGTTYIAGIFDIAIFVGIICSLVLRNVYADKAGDDTPAEEKISHKSFV